ncbi:MAG: UDP-N-acetylmuramoyl-L-alanyl-D-glutamate--2,6-diaminopimelate ligase [Lachnospiraceae bacterium]|nr:UDP-N-acetylmuramoyl-L-alanyl-D-glutamate--2,6-diaminopimelate ligase [Lachnospiraceae bacterium]
MKLSALLENVDYKLVSGSTDTEIGSLARDNRKADAGCLFICTRGARFDTHDSEVMKALSEAGAAAFVVEEDVDYEGPAAVVRVADTRIVGAHIYAAWYGHPAEKLTMIGITGSKGKTTTAHMIAGILKASGRKVGLIGTNGVSYGNVSRELANTTPDYDELQMLLRAMLDDGADTCVLEVSSQAVKKHRVEGITFDLGIWMNIQEGDHVGPNEHETFEDYFLCKAGLLRQSRKALVHADDPLAGKLLETIGKSAVLFGAGDDADYRASDIEAVFDEKTRTPGIAFTAAKKEGFFRGAEEGKKKNASSRFFVNLPGDFNTWNALAAITASDILGAPLSAMHEALQNVHIKGRDDMVYRGRFQVCVDFAHNGESTWAHLRAMREYRPKRLICIFGPDGNRSIGRRLGMGEAAGTLADLAIVTSGHNRWETFEQILHDTETGLLRAPHPNYIAIKDRAEAIRWALENAREGDLITIIGLGHEHWQEEMGVKRHWNDEEFVLKTLGELGLL